MPVKRIQQPNQEYPELVSELRRVLREDRQDGPEGEPEITIEPIRFSNNLHVTVVWDKWKDVDLETRGHIILTAFAEELGEAEMLRITLAMGLTKEEAYRLKVREAFGNI